MTDNFIQTDEVDRAILYYIRHKIEIAYWNKYQKEIEDSPFENAGSEMIITGEEFKIEIKAYNWEKEEDGYFKLWCFDKLYYEYKWYKHFMRGLEVKRHDEEREVFLSLVLEFLEDIDSVEIR